MCGCIMGCHPGLGFVVGVLGGGVCFGLGDGMGSLVFLSLPSSPTLPSALFCCSRS